MDGDKNSDKRQKKERCQAQGDCNTAGEAQKQRSPIIATDCSVSESLLEQLRNCPSTMGQVRVQNRGLASLPAAEFPGKIEAPSKAVDESYSAKSKNFANLRGDPAPQSIGADQLKIVISTHKAGSPVAQRAISSGIPAKRPIKLKTSKKPNNSLSGRWTNEEHREFLRGFQLYGREWKKVATLIPTRSSAQVRSHAQKYFVRMERNREQHQDYKHGVADETTQNTTISTSSSQNSFVVEDTSLATMPESVRAQAERILARPETVQAEVNTTLELLKQRYKQLQEQLREKQREERRARGAAEVMADDDDNPAVEEKRDENVRDDSSIESLHGEELIALHVLHEGLVPVGNQNNGSNSKRRKEDGNEGNDPAADSPGTFKRPKLD